MSWWINIKIKSCDKLWCLSIFLFHYIDLFICQFPDIWHNRNHQTISRFASNKLHNKDQVCNVMRCHLTLEIETWSQSYQSPKGISFYVELRSIHIHMRWTFRNLYRYLTKSAHLPFSPYNKLQSRQLHRSRQQ